MPHRLLLQQILLALPMAAASLLFAGCPQQTPVAKTPTGTNAKTGDGEHGHHHHSHGEKGPHDGALVAIGEDAAHLEVVLDSATGKLTVYVLDGAAQNPIPIKAGKLQIDFTKSHAHEADEKKAEGDEKPAGGKDELPEASTVMLTPVSPAEDGSSSVFEGESEDLKGVEEFDAVLTAINIGGKDHEKIKFNYPEGNEHDHHH